MGGTWRRRLRWTLPFSILIALLALPTSAGVAKSDSADLALDQTASPEVVVGGLEVTYSLAVTNGGPKKATAVQVVDVLPTGAIFSQEASDPRCLLGTPPTLVVCDVGLLAVGHTVDFDIVAATPCLAGRVTNTASASAEEIDPDPADNSSSVQTIVLGPCAMVTANVQQGGTVTTDPAGEGPDPATGVFETASVVVPRQVSGRVSVLLAVDPKGEPGGICPDLDRLLATTTSPIGSTTNRLTLAFRYDACAIPEGTEIGEVEMTKSVDGVEFLPVPRCRGPISPDPCVDSARELEDGDFLFTIRWSGGGDPGWRPR